MYLKKPYMHITLKVVHKFSIANQVKLVMITWGLVYWQFINQLLLFSLL